MSSGRYPAYTPSGIDWLGEIPSHWQVAPIKAIVSVPVTDGPHETPDFLNAGIPFVSAEAVSTGQIIFEKIRGYISEEDHIRYSKKYKPVIGDIFIVKSGATTGVSAIVETDVEFNIWSPLAAIRCGAKAVPRFVLNFFRSKNFAEAITLNWSFGTQQNIGMGVIENLRIVIPPLSEQRAIAAFLDRETAKIDALIAEQERLIALLQEKRQAVISQAVTKGLDPTVPMKDSGVEWIGVIPKDWCVVKVGQITAKIGSGKTPSGGAEVYESSGVLFIRSQNVHDTGLQLDDVVYISKEIDDAMSSTRVQPGDVLLNITGASLGRTCVVPSYLPQANVNQHVCIIRPDGTTDSEFLGFFMQSHIAKLQIELLQNGAAREGLNFQQISNIVLPRPRRLLEMRQVVEQVSKKLAEIESAVTAMSSSISLLRERRAALISAAVTGKIDVREAGAKPAEAA